MTEQPFNETKSLTERVSMYVCFAALAMFLCMFVMPPVVYPELFQNDYELLRAIKNNPFYIIAHLIQIVATCFIYCGIVTFCLIAMGTLKVEEFEGEPPSGLKTTALLFMAFGAVGAHIACNFLIVDGFGLMEVALRWFNVNMTPEEIVNNSSEVLAIDNGYVTGMMIFWSGITPMFFGSLLRSMNPQLKVAANLTIFFSCLTFLAGIGYALIFFTQFFSLSEGNADMTPYYSVTSIMFLVSGLTLLAVGNLTFAMARSVKQARLNKKPIVLGV